MPALHCRNSRTEGGTTIDGASDTPAAKPGTARLHLRIGGVMAFALAVGAAMVTFLAEEPAPFATPLVAPSVDDPPPVHAEVVAPASVEAPPVAEVHPEPAAADTDLDRLRAALAGVRCAVLHVDAADGAPRIGGTVASPDAMAAVQRLAEGVHATVAVETALPALCEPLSLVDALIAANAARGTALAVLPVPGDGRFAEGQDLVLDLRAPDFPAYLHVDGFAADGNVVHLLPNPLEPSAALEPGATRRLGERSTRTRFWTIGPPFGRELILVIASAAPLFPTPRPEAEPAADYLPELKRMLTAIEADGTPAVAVALFIATHPR